MAANETKNMPIAQAWVKCGAPGAAPNLDDPGMWTYRSLSGFQDGTELVVAAALNTSGPISNLTTGFIALTLEQPQARAESVIQAAWNQGQEAGDVDPLFYGNQIEEAAVFAVATLASFAAFASDPNDVALNPFLAPTEESEIDPYQVIVINLDNESNANGPGDLLVTVWSTPIASGARVAPTFFTTG